MDSEIGKLVQRGNVGRVYSLLNARPAGKQTAEEDKALAWACLELSGGLDRELTEKALVLLLSHEKEFREDWTWHSDMARACVYLERGYAALPHLRKALQLNPGDPNLEKREEECLRDLRSPFFRAPFRERTRRAWNAFRTIEEELRTSLATGEADTELCMSALEIAFNDPVFELDQGRTLPRLVLSPEGNEIRLVQLIYFQAKAPEDIRKRWEIRIGNVRTPGFWLEPKGAVLRNKDVLLWGKRTGKRRMTLEAWSRKLLPALREDPEEARRYVEKLLYATLGELAAMRYVDRIVVRSVPRRQQSIEMRELPFVLKRKQWRLSVSPGGCLESRKVVVRREPDPTVSDLPNREDIVDGFTVCPQLEEGWKRGDDHWMNMLHNDGAVAGYFYFTMDSFSPENRIREVQKFLDRLEEELGKDSGPEQATFVGEFVGSHCGYLDFIAWDLLAFQEAAGRVFRRLKTVRQAGLQVFRKGTDRVPLYNNVTPGRAAAEETYAPRDALAVKDCIRKNFGPCERTFVEEEAWKIRLDLWVVAPTPERDWYQVVTVGMGAQYIRNNGSLPADPGRIELAIALPPDWNLNMDAMADRRWSWPLEMLRRLARFPINPDTPVYPGQVLRNPTYFSGNGGFTDLFLLRAWTEKSVIEVCPLPGGGSVQFLQVIPLYPEEADLIRNQGVEAFRDRFLEQDSMFHVGRTSVVEKS